ncbi:rna-directed dna polymerase from mobile element jockey-like [Willisornis vidua]|uniref:Rna-directed dna polymerase from mobile element jockey-like n=1 Tax=Willisornis vidua TaxID=1566151 RepID=A0ABQ9DAS6_9PASS|nr:rna-directed dna polymerase from mobile element jockey-like [Willisornis vidua]
MQQVQCNERIRPIQAGFVTDRSCLTSLMSFCDRVTYLVEEGKDVNAVYLDFSKAFDTVSCIFFLQKQATHGLDGCTVHWVKNWLDDCTQRVVVD